MKILLLGGNGQIGWHLQRSLCLLGQICVPSSRDLDLLDTDKVVSHIEEGGFDVVVNAAAYTQVDKAEIESDKAHALNTNAVSSISQCVARIGSVFVHFSTDYVFDGEKSAPYSEGDAAKPLGVYGKTKLAGEASIIASGCRHLIFRTSWVYSARGKNFPKAILKKALDGQEIKVVANAIGAPTSAEHVAMATSIVLDKLNGKSQGLSGLYHLTAAGSISWYEYAVFLLTEAKRLGFPIETFASSIVPVEQSSFVTPAKRPLNSQLCCEKLRHEFNLSLPDWRVGLVQMLEELEGVKRYGP